MIWSYPGLLRPARLRLGYVEGETLLARSAEGNPVRLAEVIRDLIEKDVGVLVVVGADAVRVAAATTKTLPIVCQSAWGPDADWHGKSLIHMTVEGSYVSADLQIAAKNVAANCQWKSQRYSNPVCLAQFNLTSTTSQP